MAAPVAAPDWEVATEAAREGSGVLLGAAARVVEAVAVTEGEGAGTAPSQGVDWVTLEGQWVEAEEGVGH